MHFKICIHSIPSNKVEFSEIEYLINNGNPKETCPCHPGSICLHNSVAGFFCQCKCGYAGHVGAEDSYTCSQRMSPETTITVEMEWVFPFRLQQLNYNYIINELIDEFLWGAMYYWNGHVQTSDFATAYRYARSLMRFNQNLSDSIFKG